MTKIIFAMLLVFGVGLSYADDAKVEITSFTFVAPRLAEICGKVSGTKAPMVGVRITVDPRSNQPGIYRVMTESDSSFCTTLVSYTGMAEATLWIPGQ